MASSTGVLTGNDSIPDSPGQSQAAASKTVKNPNIALNEHAQWKPRVNPWAIAATVALAAFMEVLDTSIANVALPHIAGDLGTSTDEGTWVLTSYLVSNAIVLPLGGWASNVIGRKNFFLLCITIFTVSSFLCGIAPTLPALLLCRVLQGAGGGGLQPMAQAIMADSFDERKRGQAFALYGLVAVLAPSIGPSLGGWITDSYSWRWIFYINIPVGILAYVLVTRLVEDPPWIKPDRKHLVNMDYIGLAFLTLAMGGLQIMLDKGEENDWFSSNFIRFFAVMFVVGLIGLIVWELRKNDPLINLRLFKYKNFAICCFLMMLVGGVLNASTVLQPQFLQQLLGYTATNAGLALTAGGFSLVVVMPFAGMLTGRFPARNIAAVGFCFFAFSFWLTTRDLSLDMSFNNASWLRVIQLAPIPFCFIPITTAAYIGIPRQQSNQVAGLINFVRNIGGSIFIAITGAAVTNRSLWHQARLQESMNSLDIPYSQYQQGLSHSLGQSFGAPQGQGMAGGAIYHQLQQQAGMLGYQDVYKMLFWMAIGMIFFTFLLAKNKPGGGGGGAAAMH
jgi:MFS transporter, DHA2 family, multidrug resistance protein